MTYLEDLTRRAADELETLRFRARYRLPLDPSIERLRKLQGRAEEVLDARTRVIRGMEFHQAIRRRREAMNRPDHNEGD